MLRAYRPDKFKTAGVNVNVATRGDVFVLSEEQRHELQAINRRRIERLNAGEVPGGTAAYQQLTQGEPRAGNGQGAVGVDGKGSPA
jgi:hypothetical protein